MSSLLDQDIKYLKGVGPVRAAMLGEELKVFTLGDFIHTFPYKYVDRTMVHTIVNLTEDMPHVQLAGTLLNLQKVGEGRSRRLTAMFTDGTGYIELVWFNGIRQVESHLKVIRLVHKLLPITKTTIEVAQFDVQKIKNPDIKGEEYQQGEQMGFWNVREYVLARDGHKCIHCKGKSKDPILNVHHLESRKTGGNSPSNLVTLCETCHKAYHCGEFELKIKRGTTFRDAAVMNIMRWAVYEQAKEEFRNVHLTYGYVTKQTRIENGITKTHAADAFCIAKNVYVIRLGTFFMCRCVPRHTRALHVANPKKGGIRRSCIASHKIGKSRFQRFDMVRWKGKECFIFGSTHGRPILRDVEGKQIAGQPSVNIKTIKFLNRLRNNILVEERTSES